ncbi:MAG: hypothetical protein H7839_04890 [Magnetococcus sp. YQC-5]
MSPESLVNSLAANGIHLYVNDVGELRHRGRRGRMTGELRAMIDKYRPEIVSWLQYDPATRPLTDNEKLGIDLAFATLKKQHGGKLVEAGWTRPVIFDGLDPTTCQTAGDVPGIIGLLMAGGRLAAIHPDRLDLEFPDGEPLVKIRGGCLLAGVEREKYLKGVSDGREVHEI